MTPVPVKNSIFFRRVGWGEKFKKEETYVYLWLICVDMWQKSTQYCKAMTLQLKRKMQNIQKMQMPVGTLKPPPPHISL